MKPIPPDVSALLTDPALLGSRARERMLHGVDDLVHPLVERLLAFFPLAVSFRRLSVHTGVCSFPIFIMAVPIYASPNPPDSYGRGFVCVRGGVI